MSQSHGAQDVLMFTVHQDHLTYGRNFTNYLRVRRELKMKEIPIIRELVVETPQDSKRTIMVPSDYTEQVKAFSKEFNQEVYYLAKTHMHGMRKVFQVDLEGNEIFTGQYLRSFSARKAVRRGISPFIDTTGGGCWILADTDETNMTKLKEMGWYS